MNNLFISYDLIAPGKNYEAVIAAIKKLGDPVFLLVREIRVQPK